MPEVIGLDFETYSGISLPKYGLARYINDPAFTPLIAGIALPQTIQGDWPTMRIDFTVDWQSAKDKLESHLEYVQICAHNAGFEKAVLDRVGLHYPAEKFIDSATIARVAGASGSLDQAAKQLLDEHKLESGLNGIKMFTMPGKLQEEQGTPLFNAEIIMQNSKEWEEFGEYCEIDAVLSLQIANSFISWMTKQERDYAAVTLMMNETGWNVDVESVLEMQRRYQENRERALDVFRITQQAPDLNLNSYPQVKKWCADRGIKANSFDEKHVAKLIKRIEEKLAAPHGLTHDQINGYKQVNALLHTKQVLGGSSLKKLQTIIDTVHPNTWEPGTYRLYDQYIHCGAGQSLRTTGRSVQMQNLKRLAVVEDMEELEDPDVDWDNEKLAENLRQVFTSSDPYGRLIVGDFSSVESRGLAWLAGEHWKLNAYANGEDIYKRLATFIYGSPYEVITKAERQTGKVGELSCGYGAGAGAVVSFAEGMGVPMGEAEAIALVRNWRNANPNIVQFWTELNDRLHAVVETTKTQHLFLADKFTLQFVTCRTPDSLLAIDPAVQSICMSVVPPRGPAFLKRYFHGCHTVGNNISYYRPTDRKTGALWTNIFVDPKTKMNRRHELYGGKLAGILTQSFCRELFFQSLLSVHRWVAGSSQIKLVGQFHDEIVLDWKPGATSLGDAKKILQAKMSNPGDVRTFPLAADIKDDYRYTK